MYCWLILDSNPRGHWQGKKASAERCSRVPNNQGWRKKLQVISQSTPPCQGVESEVPSNVGGNVCVWGISSGFN